MESIRFRQLLGIGLLLTGWGCGGNGDLAVAEQTSTDSSSEEEAKHKPNRLADETSPYLLLHQHNPVDWYPWGEEAFAKATKENKPIFLSIGYSSCYWCHVMERQVFENKEIAEYMNEHFVNVKVDREERPDVDDIYMTSLQIYFQLVRSPQGGGWPLSIFLTPEGKPFVGGTYFPPEDDRDEAGNLRRVGFLSVLKQVHNLWETDRAALEQNANIITEQVRLVMKPGPVLVPVQLDLGLVNDAVAAVQKTYDVEHGGIDYYPEHFNPSKFPVPAKLAILQRDIRQTASETSEKIIDHTLTRIAHGGIRDHLGGGFHRYSTDREWHVPHFEKMLYDQAQLLDVYAAAYERTDNPLYREVCAGIVKFVQDEMTDKEGGFYSALDAETDGVEGEHYVWSAEEIDRLVGDDAELFKEVYGLNEPKVFEHGYVLHQSESLEEIAKRHAISRDELQSRLEPMRQKLLAERNKRKALLKDDKVLTSWNGLMIRGLANAGVIFEEPEYIAAAEKAALFVLGQMRDEEGRLFRSYRAGKPKLNAYLDDYAFLVEALIALFDATKEEKWLNAAQRLTEDQITQFWDEKGDGFFFTSHHHEELIARTKHANDAVLPSGNSVTIRNLLDLAEHSGEEKYTTYAEKTLKVFAPSLERSPRSMTNMAIALGEFIEVNPVEESNTEAESETTPIAEDIEGELPESEGTILQVGGESTEEQIPHVVARAYFSVDKLPAGKTCQVVVFLDIKEGWHINTNPAQPKSLIPTVLALNSTHGTKLSKVVYPPGKSQFIPNLDEKQTFYETRVALRGTVTVPAEAAGKKEAIELRIRYQACNENVCLRPTVITLKGALSVAGEGEEVKAINQKVFPKRSGE